MDSKSSVPSSSSSPPTAGGVAAQEAVPVFSREERAALQWVLERKERDPTKVCALFACCWLLAACLFSVFFDTLHFSSAVPVGGAMG